MNEKQAQEMISILKEISSNTKKILENTSYVDNSDSGRDDICNKIASVEAVIRNELLPAIKDLAD